MGNNVNRNVVSLLYIENNDVVVRPLHIDISSRRSFYTWKFNVWQCATCTTSRGGEKFFGSLMREELVQTMPLIWTRTWSTEKSEKV